MTYSAPYWLNLKRYTRYEAPLLIERSNDQWVGELEAPGEAQEGALSDLRVIILRGLPYALSKWMR